MSYIIPDSRFEMPELFEPGRKPVGNVQIDWTHPQAQQLEHYIPLYTGNRHDLVTNNPPTIAGNPVFKNEGCEFDGIGDYLRYPLTSRVDFSTPFTVAVWCIPLSTWSAFKVLVASGGNPSFPGFAVRNGGPGTRTNGFINIADALNFQNTESDNPIYVINQLHHIVGVFPGGGAAGVLYLDGEEVAQTVTGSGTPSGSFPDFFSVCARYQDSAGAVDGLIYGVRIYSRALNIGDILRLYKNETADLIPA